MTFLAVAHVDPTAIQGCADCRCGSMFHACSALFSGHTLPIFIYNNEQQREIAIETLQLVPWLVPTTSASLSLFFWSLDFPAARCIRLDKVVSPKKTCGVHIHVIPGCY